MGQKTDAQINVDEAKKHIDQAIEHIANVIVRKRMDGRRSLSTVFIKQLRQALNALLDISEDLH